MLPGFSADAGLTESRERFRGARRAPHSNTAIYPTQLVSRGNVIGGRGMPDGRGDAAAANTCTCPCCVKHHGHLVCC
jgi:hypothetical protein